MVYLWPSAAIQHQFDVDLQAVVSYPGLWRKRALQAVPAQDSNLCTDFGYERQVHVRELPLSHVLDRLRRRADVFPPAQQREGSHAVDALCRLLTRTADDAISVGTGHVQPLAASQRQLHEPVNEPSLPSLSGLILEIPLAFRQRLAMSGPP